jgi:endonuclease/exonuclease/phosphatase family metal-dependent hydrolase
MRWRGLLAAILGLSILAISSVGWRLRLSTHESLPAAAVTAAPPPAGVLRVVTLNLAHGRGLSSHQSLLRRTTIADNLARVAAVLTREQPAVVGLQEADGPSLWSGHFDHIRAIAEAAGLSASFRGRHMHGLGPLRLDYGTALLSRTPLTSPQSQTFRKAVWDTKGFVMATLRPAALVGEAVVAVSVHLDFASIEVRARQVADLVAALSPVRRPLLLMGDFNCEQSESSCVPALTAALGLSVAAPRASDATFPCAEPKRRIDWILVSPDFAVQAQRVLDDPLSDHCAVVADLVRLTPGTPTDSR